LIPSRVIRFHQFTSDALDHSITEQELGDYKLKKQICALEYDLSPRPLFTEPLSMMTPDKFPEEISRSNSKVKKAAKLLMDIKKYAVENINKRLSKIFEACHISTDSCVMTDMLFSIREYL
jgi:hypothetical protein